MSADRWDPWAEDQLAEGRAERDKGMAAAGARLGADWDKAVIDQAIRVLAATGREFNADDVRDRLPAVAHALIGSRFMAASKRGLIERVGDQQSRHRSRHASRVGLWRGRRQAALPFPGGQAPADTSTTPSRSRQSPAALAPSSRHFVLQDSDREDTPS